MTNKIIQDAIREPIKTQSIDRLARGTSDNHKNVNGAPGQVPHTLHQPKPNRSTTFRRDGSKREQAIIGQTKGTHRPDRKDPEYHPLGRNKRSVWEVSTISYTGAHYAVFPPKLIRPCILAGCPPGGVVLDPFIGSGTVAQVAIETGRQWLGVELNPQNIELAEERIAQAQPALIPPKGEGEMEPQPRQMELL